MMTFRHTINIAAALNIVVYDDQGNLLDEFIFPFALFFFTLPGLLYGWLRTAFIGLADFASALVVPTGPVLSFAKWPAEAIEGWRADLTIIGWAARLLIHQRRLAYA